MSSEGGGECLVPYRPWSSISTSDPNSTLLVKYRQGVLAYIMAHPGVTLVCVRTNVYLVDDLVSTMIRNCVFLHSSNLQVTSLVYYI